MNVGASSSTSRMMSTEGFVQLQDGTELPYETLPSPIPLIVGHGLGSDPAAKSHHDDVATVVVREVLSKHICHVAASKNSTAVFYTARGHGQSHGWEKGASSSEDGPSMFNWSNLAEDMLSVAIICGLNSNNTPFLAMGQSMGATTALYMAFKNPNSLISGLVLMRPPRAWESRKKIKHMYVKNAMELQQARPGTFHHFVLIGASETDLPPREDDSLYKTITCPVLILCHGNDEAHPVSTGKILQKLIPHARLQIVADEETARHSWPKIIANWLHSERFITRTLCPSENETR